jgi:Redoxin
MRLLRTALAAAASCLCLGTAVVAFWYQDWQYSLPTPKPEGLEQPALGTAVDLQPVFGRRYDGRAVVVHVVDPDCPCSRFNRDHLRALVRRFGDDVAFVALVQGSDDAEALTRSFARWNIAVEVVADPGGRRAKRLGAYSTPQAVVIDRAGRLYYRGNYNTARYCVDTRTEFARIAIESVLAGSPLPAMPVEAQVAYGCPLRHPPVLDDSPL